MSIELNAHQTQLLTEAIAALGSDGFGPAMQALLGAFVRFDSSVFLVYPADETLHVLHNALAEADRVVFDGPYTGGLFLLSPLYLQVTQGRRGCFHISELAPEGFTDSEFFQLYYSRNGCIDQMAFLLESDQGIAMALTVERTQALPAFTAAERELLTALTDLVSHLARQHRWRPDTNLKVPTDGTMRAHLDSCLDRFGSSILTPRERQVVRLILRGYPSKSVANELTISIQTEQVHRKNIYQKLSISSHAELFSLFFDAIASGDKGTDDPLLTLRDN